MKRWKPLLKAAQEKNASTQTYKVKDRVGTQSTVGGLDADTWLLLQLQGDPEYKIELDKVKFTDPDLFKRQADKKLYEDAIAAAGNDVTKLAEVEATTTYGRGLKDLKDAIETARLVPGAELTQDEINVLAQEVYDKGLDRELAILSTHSLTVSLSLVLRVPRAKQASN